MTPKNILLIRLSSLGDVLHGTPVAKTLRAHFPAAKISWIVGEKSQEILQGNPYLDKIIVWQREKWEEELRKGVLRKSYASFHLLEEQLKEDQYDLTIDMHGLLLTGLISWRSGAPMRIGFARAKEGSPFFYTHKVKSPTQMQIVHHYLQLLQPLGLQKGCPQMVMPVAADHHRFADNLLRSHGIKEEDMVLAISPFTSWATKCWPAAYFAALVNFLQDDLQAKVILLGAPDDLPLLAKIVAGSSRPVINLAGKVNLKELAAVMQKSHLFIGGDTGPLHIAAAVGTPTLSLFGPTNPHIYAPVGENHAVIVSDVACRYCHKRACENFICMESIGLEEVYRAVRKMLNREKPQKRYMEATAYGQVPVKKIRSLV